MTKGAGCGWFVSRRVKLFLGLGLLVEVLYSILIYFFCMRLDNI